MEIIVQSNALCDGENVDIIKESPLKHFKVRDITFGISNNIYERDFKGNKYKFYPYLFNKASIVLSKKTGIEIDTIKKQITTIFIDFNNGGEGKRDVIEIGKNQELLF